MRKLFLLASTTVLMAGTGASAATLTLDPFDVAFNDDTTTEIVLNTGSTTTGPTTLDNGIIRTVDFTVNTNQSPNNAASARIRITGGEFSLNNDNDVDSTVGLNYDVGGLFDQAMASSGSDGGMIDLTVLFADTRRSLQLFVNGEQTDFTTNDFGVGQGGDTPNSVLTSLSFDASALNNGGDDEIRLQIDGLAGLDYRLDILGANFPDQNVPVPAPAVLGLFGLGLAGLGFARRRKAA